MRLSIHHRPARANQEIKIRAAIGLHYVVMVQPVIAALRRRRWCLPRCTSSLDLRHRNIQMKPAIIHVQLDHIAVLDEGEQTTRCCFRRHM